MIKPLFTVTPDIHTKKVAIYGTDNNALLMFSVLLQNDVYVSCFITNDDTQCQMHIMNKPVVTLASIQDEKEQYTIIMSGQAMATEAEKLDGGGYHILFDYNKTSYDGDSVMIRGE